MFLLAGMPLFGQASPLGVVTQTTNGHLNTAATSVGTTVYNGDRLSADAGGTLGVRLGSVQLILPGDSALFIAQDGPTLTAALQSGSVAFTVEPGGLLQVTAVDVRVRPQSGALTAGQVTLEDCAIVVTSRTASLEVTAGKEVKIVDAGQSYRVTLNTGCGRHPMDKPVAPIQSRFLLLPIIVGGGITIWAIHKAFESPDRP
jgi:hypothetical protein